MRKFIQVLATLIVAVVGSHYYLSNYTEYVVAEKECVGPSSLAKIFIQINQYSAITNLWGGPSDGNLMVTYEGGAKDYVSHVTFVGEGNQKVAIFKDTKWTRYVFANGQLFAFSGRTLLQCY